MDMGNQEMCAVVACGQNRILESAADRRLADAIEATVRQRTAGRIHNLEVVARGNDVRLQGRCATFYYKQLAQHAAMAVAGVRLLVNDIVVG